MKIGYIGSGPISNFHIPAIKNNEFKIEAIGSRKDSTRCKNFASQYQIEEHYCKGGWEEVVSKDLDAFVICVDISATIKVLEKALLTNKPIFVEKPISSNPNTLKRFLNHDNIDNVFVGYNRRFYKTTNKLKDLCLSSKGGTIFLNMPESDYGIKQFINNGCHMIDTLRYLVGDFKIIGKSKKIDLENNDLFSFSALCRNQKWDILINAHSQIPANFSITVNSDKSVFELKPIEKLSIYNGIDVIEPTKKEPIRKYMPHLQNSYVEDSKFKPGFNSMYKNFKLFIEKKECNICNFKDAYSSIKTCWDLIENEKDINSLITKL